MPIAKIQFRELCREAGVVDAEACAEELEKKVAPQIQKTIDTFKKAEQNRLAATIKTIPTQAACMSLWEYQMVVNLNRDRASHHLSALQVDCDLVQAAKNHSFDMAIRDYFSHEDPEGKGPGDRIFPTTKRFLCIAENIAMSNGYDWEKVSATAEKQLMDSPGHKANILAPYSTHIGIGIFKGQKEIFYTTQNFGSTDRRCIDEMKKKQHP